MLVCTNTHGHNVYSSFVAKGKKIYKNITCEHIHTEQKLMCCSCNPLRFLRLCLSIILSSMDQSFSLFIPLPANAHIGVSCCPCTQTRCPTVTHQYLWSFLLAVVPAWTWLLGSVCLVLNWLHKLHQRRGFTLNGIFGLFIGWTLQAESYLMRHVSIRQRGLRLIPGVPECVRVCFFNKRTYVFAWVHG